MQGFIEIFGVLPDPRAANARHDLVEIMFIALAATLCGATNCTEMALFAQAKEMMLRKILRLKHGVPSHDTFSAVFRVLDPSAFAQVFSRFAAAGGGSNHRDQWQGHAVRRDKGRRHAPPFMVTAWGY